MTEDVWTTLRIMNCTSLALVGYPDSYSNYQMTFWFAPAEQGSATLPLSSKTSGVFPLQFSRGVGDQDDIANLVISVQDPVQAPTPANQIAWLRARSLSNSGHYLEVVVLDCQVGAGPFVIGAVTTPAGDWTSGAGNVQWYNCSTFKNQTFPLNLYPPPLLSQWRQTPNQAIAIVDLSQFYDAAAATSVASDITHNRLDSMQKMDLWTEVMHYTNLGPSS